MQRSALFHLKLNILWGVRPPQWEQKTPFPDPSPLRHFARLPPLVEVTAGRLYYSAVIMICETGITGCIVTVCSVANAAQLSTTSRLRHGTGHHAAGCRPLFHDAAN